MNTQIKINLDKYVNGIDSSTLFRDVGKVTQVTGFLIRGYIPGACLGALCEIRASHFREPFFAEVVGFRDREVLMMPLGNMTGIGLGSQIVLEKTSPTLNVGRNLLGRVINGLGEPMDGKGPLQTDAEVSLYQEVSNPLNRPPIDEVLAVGVRSIDGLLTLGKGQRVGILAGSGVGKSVLLGMMARHSRAKVNVIGLIGERGREVREFIERVLGPEGMKKSVIVCATSDDSALLRTRAAFATAAVAEYFSQSGDDVLLMMDSVTRFAMAQREIGLNVGEPPSTKGYTPSCFALLPKLLERAGRFDGQGSITGIYTVLIEGDDLDEPIGDAVRSIVDGHIVLDRHLASRGHFPSVDVLKSTSRVMRSLVSSDHIAASQAFREALAVYKDAEDLINIGAYKPGTSPNIDRSVRWLEGMNRFLKQGVDEDESFDSLVSRLENLTGS